MGISGGHTGIGIQWLAQRKLGEVVGTQAFGRSGGHRGSGKRDEHTGSGDKWWTHRKLGTGDKGWTLGIRVKAESLAKFALLPFCCDFWIGVRFKFMYNIDIHNKSRP